MRMTILVDNRPGHGLRGSWAWSIYVEHNGKRILFDAGNDPLLLEENASKLGIDLGQIDLAVLSHHHKDHYGGLAAVAERSPGTMLYVPPGRRTEYEEMGFDVRVVEKPVEPYPGAMIVGPLYSREVGLYELALALKTSAGPVVIVGCSHPGVDMIVEQAVKLVGAWKARLVIGGFHAPPLHVVDRLAGIAETLCPTHCSGDKARRYLARRYPGKYCDAVTGTTLEV